MPSDAISHDQVGYLHPAHTDLTIGAQIAGIAFEHPNRTRWFIAFGICVLLTFWMAACIGWLLYWGVGVWGNNIPVAWALDITSYDWWMGNACGAMIISALLLLLRQYWRGAINRLAETVALIAACAGGVYPIIHLGRPWFFYWTLPYPNNLLLWPQFRSPLVWDALDILSFILIAFLVWYIGMLPDLGTLRDRASGLLRKRLYGVAALGWRGSAIHWSRWLQAYRILALLGLLQAICLQSGAAIMYAGTLEPGWHDTLLPVFFIADSVFQGAGLIAVVVAVVRYIYPIRSLITRRHLDILGRILLAAGLLVIYCYSATFLITTLGGDSYDRASMLRDWTGLYAASFWVSVAAGLLPIHVLWFRTMRRSSMVLFLVGLGAMAAMWGDHFMTLVVTQHHDFLPSSQAFYTTSFWAVSNWIGTIGLSGMLFLLVLRYLPVASIIEIRLVAHQQQGGGDV